MESILKNIFNERHKNSEYKLRTLIIIIIIPVLTTSLVWIICVNNFLLSMDTVTNRQSILIVKFDTF